MRLVDAGPCKGVLVEPKLDDAFFVVKDSNKVFEEGLAKQDDFLGTISEGRVEDDADATFEPATVLQLVGHCRWRD